MAIKWHHDALQERIGGKRWYLADDFQNEVSDTFRLLMSAHRDILSACIHGDLPYRYSNDPTFRYACDTYHAPERRPGIYVNWICRRTTQPYAGSGFTRAELRNVMDMVAVYFDTQDPRSASLAKKVDLAFPAITAELRNLDWDSGVRRFFVRDDLLDDFVNEINSQYLDRYESLTTVERDQPLRKCLSETGWGKNCHNRLLDHQTLRLSNILLGLIYSIAEAAYPARFHLKFIQLFHITEAEQAQVSELVGTLLCGSYWIDGGLNPALAGNCRVTDEDEPALVEARRFVLMNSKLWDNIEADRRLMEEISTLEQFVKDRADIETQRVRREAHLKQESDSLVGRAQRADLILALTELEEIEDQFNRL